MKTTVEAVFEDGVFKPISRPAIPEGQHVQITVQSIERLGVDDTLRLATRVYQGLSAADIDQVEDMARRRVFFTREPDGCLRPNHS